MDMSNALEALGALSQESRLAAFRLLIRSGADGMAAGKIARALNVPHNTMSSHLAILGNAGLVASRRGGRSIIYRADYDGTRALLAFLMEDCCQGSRDVCAPLLARVLPAAGVSEQRGQSNEAPAH